MRGTIPVQGGRIRITDTGGSGSTVVLVHGDWTDSSVWRPLIALLRDQFRVIAYDELGFGDSPPPTSTCTRPATLRTLVDRLGIERATLVAHSGGSDPVLALVLDDPGRVAGLVLIAPGAHDYPWETDDPYFREFTRLSELGDQGALVNLALRTWAPTSDAGARRHAAEPGITRLARSQFRRAVTSWVKIGVLAEDGPPVYERLAEITTPTEVLVGDAEYPAVDRSSRDFADRIPGARLTVVPDADHLLPLRAPGAIMRALESVAAAS